MKELENLLCMREYLNRGDHPRGFPEFELALKEMGDILGNCKLQNYSRHRLELLQKKFELHRIKSCSKCSSTKSDQNTKTDSQSYMPLIQTLQSIRICDNGRNGCAGGSTSPASKTFGKEPDAKEFMHYQSFVEYKLGTSPSLELGGINIDPADDGTWELQVEPWRVPEGVTQSYIDTKIHGNIEKLFNPLFVGMQGGVVEMHDHRDNGEQVTGPAVDCSRSTLAKLRTFTLKVGLSPIMDYYVWEKLEELNAQRVELGYPLIQFRAQCNGTNDSLYVAYLLADSMVVDSVGCLTQLPVLQHALFLSQIGITIAANEYKVNNYQCSELFKRGLNVSCGSFLSPKKEHFIDSIAHLGGAGHLGASHTHFGKVASGPVAPRRLPASPRQEVRHDILHDMIDLCEMARNSVQQSSYTLKKKMFYLGLRGIDELIEALYPEIQSQSAGRVCGKSPPGLLSQKQKERAIISFAARLNDEKISKIPNVRHNFRVTTLRAEREAILGSELQFANESAKSDSMKMLRWSLGVFQINTNILRQRGLEGVASEGDNLEDFLSDRLFEEFVKLNDQVANENSKEEGTRESPREQHLERNAKASEDKKICVAPHEMRGGNPFFGVQSRVSLFYPDSGSGGNTGPAPTSSHANTTGNAGGAPKHAVSKVSTASALKKKISDKKKSDGQRSDKSDSQKKSRHKRQFTDEDVDAHSDDASDLTSHHMCSSRDGKNNGNSEGTFLHIPPGTFAAPSPERVFPNPNDEDIVDLSKPREMSPRPLATLRSSGEFVNLPMSPGSPQRSPGHPEDSQEYSQENDGVEQVSSDMQKALLGVENWERDNSDNVVVLPAASSFNNTPRGAGVDDDDDPITDPIGATISYAMNSLVGAVKTAMGVDNQHEEEEKSHGNKVQDKSHAIDVASRHGHANKAHKTAGKDGHRHAGHSLHPAEGSATAGGSTLAPPGSSRHHKHAASGDHHPIGSGQAPVEQPEHKWGHCTPPHPEKTKSSHAFSTAAKPSSTSAKAKTAEKGDHGAEKPEYVPLQSHWQPHHVPKNYRSKTPPYSKATEPAASKGNEPALLPAIEPFPEQLYNSMTTQPPTPKYKRGSSILDYEEEPVCEGQQGSQMGDQVDGNTTKRANGEANQTKRTSVEQNSVTEANANTQKSANGANAATQNLANGRNATFVNDGDPNSANGGNSNAVNGTFTGSSAIRHAKVVAPKAAIWHTPKPVGLPSPSPKESPCYVAQEVHSHSHSYNTSNAMNNAMNTHEYEADAVKGAAASKPHADTPNTAAAGAAYGVSTAYNATTASPGYNAGHPSKDTISMTGTMGSGITIGVFGAQNQACRDSPRTASPEASPRLEGTPRTCAIRGWSPRELARPKATVNAKIEPGSVLSGDRARIRVKSQIRAPPLPIVMIGTHASSSPRYERKICTDFVGMDVDRTSNKEWLQSLIDDSNPEYLHPPPCSKSTDKDEDHVSRTGMVAGKRVTRVNTMAPGLLKATPMNSQEVTHTNTLGAIPIPKTNPFNETDNFDHRLVNPEDDVSTFPDQLSEILHTPRTGGRYFHQQHTGDRMTSGLKEEYFFRVREKSNAVPTRSQSPMSPNPASTVMEHILTRPVSPTPTVRVLDMSTRVPPCDAQGIVTEVGAYALGSRWLPDNITAQKEHNRQRERSREPSMSGSRRRDAPFCARETTIKDTNPALTLEEKVSKDHYGNSKRAAKRERSAPIRRASVNPLFSPEMTDPEGRTQDSFEKIMVKSYFAALTGGAFEPMLRTTHHFQQRCTGNLNRTMNVPSTKAGSPQRARSAGPYRARVGEVFGPHNVLSDYDLENLRNNPAKNRYVRVKNGQVIGERGTVLDKLMERSESPELSFQNLTKSPPMVIRNMANILGIFDDPTEENRDDCKSDDELSIQVGQEVDVTNQSLFPVLTAVRPCYSPRLYSHGFANLDVMARTVISAKDTFLPRCKENLKELGNRYTYQSPRGLPKRELLSANLKELPLYPHLQNIMKPPELEIAKRKANSANRSRATSPDSRTHCENDTTTPRQAIGDGSRRDSFTGGEDVNASTAGEGDGAGAPFVRGANGGDTTQGAAGPKGKTINLLKIQPDFHINHNFPMNSLMRSALSHKQKQKAAIEAEYERRLRQEERRNSPRRTRVNEDAPEIREVEKAASASESDTGSSVQAEIEAAAHANDPECGFMKSLRMNIRALKEAGDGANQTSPSGYKRASFAQGTLGMDMNLRGFRSDAPRGRRTMEFQIDEVLPVAGEGYRTNRVEGGSSGTYCRASLDRHVGTVGAEERRAQHARQSLDNSRVIDKFAGHRHREMELQRILHKSLKPNKHTIPSSLSSSAWAQTMQDRT